MLVWSRLSSCIKQASLLLFSLGSLVTSFPSVVKNQSDSTRNFVYICVSTPRDRYCHINSSWYEPQRPFATLQHILTSSLENAYACFKFVLSQAIWFRTPRDHVSGFAWNVFLFSRARSSTNCAFDSCSQAPYTPGSKISILMAAQASPRTRHGREVGVFASKSFRPDCTVSVWPRRT